MQVKTQPDELLNYLNDASNMSGGHAEKLFIPESTEQIAEILREANETKTQVTISGARTGTVGGAIPFGGIVVSLEKLNQIKIDKSARTATVGAGAVLGDLQKAVEAEGLFYPPDPTEWSCQIGGNVATNASGARSFKYGATREYVRRLIVVLTDGDVLEMRRGEFVSDDSGLISVTTKSGSEIRLSSPTYGRPRVRKNSSGYFGSNSLDAIDLFIGSEGTLGVIAEVELNLLPKPESFFSGITFFDYQANLLSFVDEVRTLSLKNFSSQHLESKSALGATLIEYFDANALKFIAGKFPDTPPDKCGAIFFEQETTDENEDKLFNVWNSLLEQHGADLESSWFTTNEQDREKMRRFRHALPLAANERYARHSFKKVSTDMAVPAENFPGFLRFYEQILSDSGIEYIIFGHIGDCHLHANLFPKTEAEAEKARHIYGRCIAQAIMLGGTVSAEHGIGKLKQKYLSVMMGERYLNEMAELKRAFDPNGILGRGNIFDESYLIGG